MRNTGAAAALIAESRSLSWHATRAVRGSGSGDRSGGDSLWAFLRRITFGVKEFQRPWVFGGVFASFCRRGQKDVAPEREISLPLEEKRTGRRGRPPLRRDRRECAGIRRCADASRRERRLLRRDRREYAGTRRCADAGRRERRPLRSKAPPRGTRERQRLLSPSPGACHSTPPARCVGAAAALIAESRSLSWHAIRAVRGSGGDSLWTFLRRITFGVKEFQRPWVFGGVFASFCRRGQKDVAPEREISLPEA